MYRIVIDRSLCSGFGACAELAPDIFELDGERHRVAPRRRQRRPGRARRGRGLPDGRDHRRRGARRHDARTVADRRRRPRRRPLRRDAARRRLRRPVVLVGDEPLAAVRATRALEGVPRRQRASDELAPAPAPFWDEQRDRARLGDAHRRRRPSGRARDDARRRARWDALVLATGARPRRFRSPLPQGVTSCGRSPTRSRCARSSRPGRRLSSSAAASSAPRSPRPRARSASQVTILEAGPAPLARLLGRGRRASSPTATAPTASTCGRPRRRPASASAPPVASNGVTLSDGSELACDTALLAVGAEPAVELVPAAAPRPIFVCGDAGGRTGHWTDAAGDGIDGGTLSRAAATAAAAAVLLVGPVRPAPPARRRPTGRGRRRPRRRRRGVRRALPRTARGRLLAVLAANRPADGRHGQT